MASHLNQIGGLWHLIIEGDAETRGREHARLVREIVGTSTAEYYAGLLVSIMRQQGPRWLPQRLVPAAAGLISWFFGLAQIGINAGSLEVEMRAFFREYGRGGAGHLIRFPDVLHWLAGKEGGHCSAVFVQGDGHARLARNFDFYGPHIWGQHRALKVSFPLTGQPWLWLGPLGIPVGGFGINASGIAVMPFSNFSRDLALRGVPVFTLMQTILEEASSLDQACSILKIARRHGGLSLLVADMKRGEAFAVAIGAKKFILDTPQDGVLVRTNHFTNLAAPSEPKMDMWQRHSRSRWQRLDYLARALPSGGGADPLTLRRLLGDRTLPDGRRCLVGDVTGSLNVASSVIMDGMQMYVADAGFPSCDAESWQKISLDELFSGQAHTVQVINQPSLLTQAERVAIHSAVEGWRLVFDERNPRQALAAFDQAITHAPDQASFYRMAGMAAWQVGDIDVSRRRFKAALALDPGDSAAQAGFDKPDKFYLECMTGRLAPRG